MGGQSCRAHLPGRERVPGIVLAMALACLAWAGETVRAADASPRPAGAATVYAGQAAVTEAELLRFLDLLPRFRAWWAAEHKEKEAHPTVRKGQADFFYSPETAAWVSSAGWEPRRFFCVLGRMAAAMFIVVEGNDMQGTRPPTMPEVSAEELELARRHLDAMLRACGQELAPIKH